MYELFNHEPNIGFLQWEEWKKYIDNDEEVSHTYYHIARSGHYSIENAKKLINYKPKHTTKETIEESVKAYIRNGIINI
ncbi:hypothetical protein MHZ36_09405 [Staphylococcus sp. ACRSN]|uniref:hypothetical protein n=1 Tax=Staphylococcus sp. ACRSN TaxID=2918214 RepID=UPI001EF306C3|nr:hypothetical protein [Staphylococcus sp. ACRSN]MCG7339508.1 hypothetical protein [Staphylococcus sp. ACRSN]